MKLFAPLIALLLAQTASAAEFILIQTNPDYAVTVDRAPRFIDAAGVPVLEPGTVLTVKAPRKNESFKVYVMTPQVFKEYGAKGAWALAFDKTGGYRMQFGRETQDLLANLDFILAPE